MLVLAIPCSYGACFVDVNDALDELREAGAAIRFSFPGKFLDGVDHKEMATAAKRYKKMKARVDAEVKRAKAIHAQTEIEKNQAACVIDTSHVTLNGRRLVA